MSIGWRTRIIHSAASAPPGFRSLATPVYRGSTTLFESSKSVTDDWDQTRARYSYGLYGTPTTFELAARIADLEGGEHCFITPGGQAAIALIYLSFARAGGHVLLPDSAYGPSRQLSERLLGRLDIETEYYDPLIGAGIGHLLRKNTQLIWCESPGSVTMEVQDIPAICAAARAANVPVALDNTYAAGVLFDAFGHGVDITMQALTKYVGGHSDLLLGSVTVRDAAHYQLIGDAQQLLGMAVSPDDCSLALRGLQTLAVRLAQHESSALLVARWFSAQPLIDRVLHPALESCPGHQYWARDFTGSSSVFSVVFRPGVPQQAMLDFIDRLELFKIGYSWGGITSLAMPFFGLRRREHPINGNLVRFNVGLEDPQDLIADLHRSLSQIQG